MKNMLLTGCLLLAGMSLSAQSSDPWYAFWNRDTAGLNPFIYVSDEYRHYFNNCGESKEWIYPVKNIVITHQDQENFSQDHFDFLRTGDGYKLISVTLSGVRFRPTLSGVGT